MAGHRAVGHKKCNQAHNFSQTWVQALHNRLFQIVRFTVSRYFIKKLSDSTINFGQFFDVRQSVNANVAVSYTP
jgi:hypothetical protein